MYYNKEVYNMSVSIRFNEHELEAVKDYAKAYDMTVSECIRRAILEKVEDEYDLKAYREAMEEYKRDPVTFTLDEVIAGYGQSEEV